MTPNEDELYRALKETVLNLEGVIESAHRAERRANRQLEAIEKMLKLPPWDD